MLKYLHRDLYSIVFQYLQQYELIQLLLLNREFYQLIMKYIKQTRFIKIQTHEELETNSNQIISVIQINKKINWNIGLWNVCEGGHMKIMKFMIEKGANDWNYGLLSACKGGHIEIMRFMIGKGANNWIWGLYYACTKSHMEIVKFMIEKGANICYHCNKSMEDHLKMINI
jgi:hypothetical protein